MMLTDLAKACRKSGLEVIEVPGRKTRGHGEMAGVKSIVCHNTAGPREGDIPSLKSVRDGHPGLSGPLTAHAALACTQSRLHENSARMAVLEALGALLLLMRSRPLLTASGRVTITGGLET